MKDHKKILRMIKWAVTLTAFIMYWYITMKKAFTVLAFFLHCLFLPITILIIGHILFAGLILNSFQGLFHSGVEFYKNKTKALKKTLAFFTLQKMNLDARFLSPFNFVRKYLPLFTSGPIFAQYKTYKSK